MSSMIQREFCLEVWTLIIQMSTVIKVVWFWFRFVTTSAVFVKAKPCWWLVDGTLCPKTQGKYWHLAAREKGWRKLKTCKVVVRAVKARNMIYMPHKKGPETWWKCPRNMMEILARSAKSSLVDNPRPLPPPKSN